MIIYVYMVVDKHTSTTLYYILDYILTLSVTGCPNPKMSKQRNSHSVGAQARPLVSNLQNCLQECVADTQCDSVDWKYVFLLRES